MKSVATEAKVLSPEAEVSKEAEISKEECR